MKSKSLFLAACMAAFLIANVSLHGVVAVSNIDNPPHEFEGSVGDFGIEHAQAFTTGSSGGYAFDSVVLSFSDVIGAPTAIVIQLAAVSGGLPGSNLLTLTGSSPGAAGEYTFTADTPLVLSANTTYCIMMSAPGSAANSFYQLDLTHDFSFEGLPGWSIADDRFFSYDNGSSWGLDPYAVARMSINVSVVPEPATYAGLLGLAALGFVVWWRKARRLGSRASSCAVMTRRIFMLIPGLLAGAGWSATSTQAAAVTVNYSFSPALSVGFDTYGLAGSTWSFTFTASGVYSDNAGIVYAPASTATLVVSGAGTSDLNGTWDIIDADNGPFVLVGDDNDWILLGANSNAAGVAFFLGDSTPIQGIATIGGPSPASPLPVAGAPVLAADFNGVIITGATLFILDDGAQFSFDTVVSAVPEPANWAALTGLGFLAFVLWRRSVRVRGLQSGS